MKVQMPISKFLLKKLKLSVGGTFKDSIIIQGDYRDKIMEILKLKGFKVKRWEVNKSFSYPF
jgi:translation initiation factor 1 (eIF-1/SUI1)